MDLREIETLLNQSDYQYRLKAVSALKDYDAAIAVPLLIGKMHDPEFLVRSFVARELGKQQTPESFAALLEIVKFDNTPNVRAEAANSISLFGTLAASHLVVIFDRDEHWLVRRSILADLVELNCPHELFEICDRAIQDEEQTVRESATDALGSLAGTTQQEQALGLLLTLASHESPRLRTRAAYALKHFDDDRAKEALARLRHDPDSKVVGAALENLLP
jgi:HEAT repeat protein